MKNESLRLDELTENMSYTKVTAYKNGTDFCDLLEKEKGFKFGDEYKKNIQIF